MSTTRAAARYTFLTASRLAAAARSPQRALARVKRSLGGIGLGRGGLENLPAQPVGDHVPCVVPLNLDVRPASQHPRRLNVLIPGMAKRAMSGGPNTAINLAYRLAARGVAVRFLSTDIPKDPDEDALWDHMQRLTGIRERLPHVSIHSADPTSPAVTVGEDDVFLATAWWTAQRVKLATRRMRTKRFLYLIQEVESGLYAWSSSYAAAEETYGLDFFAIVNEQLVFDHLAANRVGRFADADFAARCVVFAPSVDRAKFYPGDRPAGPDGKRRLVFYARPNAPRNLYEMGVVALKRAVAAGAFPADEWELLYIGEPLPPGDLGHRQTIRSLPWLGFEDYAALLRGTDVGLSLMLSPHTSYPPLELAACGAQVVTNTFSAKTAELLAALSDNLIAVEPTLEAITSGLIEAARRCRSGGHVQGLTESVPGSWDEVFESLIPRVMTMIDQCVPVEESLRAAERAFHQI